MSHPAPLALSQQAVSWILQALGLLAEARGERSRLRYTSASTVKSARRGDHVLESWDELLAELLSVLAVKPTHEQRVALAASLRDWDQRVSQLDIAGLTLDERMPAVLKVLAPHIGIRFGVLAVIAEATDNLRVPVGDWLCEPLSPRGFGRAVEWLLLQHHPEWKTWEERTAQLTRQGVANKRTIDRWRSKRLAVPNVNAMLSLAALMGRDVEARSLAILRVARLLTVLRRDLAAWSGDLAAEGYEEVVASWARVTRAALSAPGMLADLANTYADALEGEHGAVVLAMFVQILGGGGLLPPELAERLRGAAASVREGGTADVLRGLVVMQLFVPSPVLVAVVGANLGVPRALVEILEDPLVLVQGEWKRQATLLAILASSTLSRELPDGSLETRELSSTLRARASALVEDGRRLCRHAGEEPISQLESIRLAIELGTLLQGPEAIQDVIELVNAGLRASVPAGMERVLDDAGVGESTHFMAERARRLAGEGQEGDALAWLDRWRRTAGPRAWPERRTAAQAAVALAHRHLDRLQKVRNSLVSVTEPQVALPEALLEKLRDTVDSVRALFAKTLRIADALSGLAGRILEAPGRDAETADRLVLLLPLALRLDCLEHEVTDTDDGNVALTRSETLGSQLPACTEALPSHGSAWAMLALWQRAMGDDPSYSLKQAVHFGSLALFESELARLVDDGFLSQEPHGP